MTNDCRETVKVGPSIVPAVDAGDQVLVDRLVAGDDDALRELVERYGGFVLGVARRVTATAALAEEVLQEVFTSLWSQPQRFDADRGSLRAYLGVQAHRRAVDAVRGENRRQAREVRSWSMERADAPAVGWGTDDGQPGDEADVAERIRRAVDRLPHEQRQAVELAFWHGRTHREVAEALGIPEGTAKSRLRLAQRKLSLWLAPLPTGGA